MIYKSIICETESVLNVMLLT